MADAADQLEHRLARLKEAVPGVRNVLLASSDGYPRAAVLDGLEPASTAALVASACKLGERLAGLTGEGGLRELVVRAAEGYVVMYTVGENGVLTVLTAPSANLARLHLEARDHLDELARLLAA
jgi:uncharacterized protein